MATAPTMNPPGAPSQGAPAQPPSQAPASPEQMMLAQIYQALKQLATQNPILSTGLQKAAAGIQEAQTALVMGPQQPSPSQNPPY